VVLEGDGHVAEERHRPADPVGDVAADREGPGVARRVCIALGVDEDRAVLRHAQLDDPVDDLQRGGARRWLLRLAVEYGRSLQGTSLPGSWIASQPGSWVDYLVWTVSGHSAQGNLTLSQLDSSQTQVTSSTEPFTATISGTSLTIDISSGASSYTGTVTPVTMQLQVPSSDGSIQQATFVPGTLDTYNSDVHALQAIASGTQQQNQQQQTIQNEQSSINQSAQAVVSDIASIASGASTLQGDESPLQQDLSGLQSDLNTVQSDANTVHNDMASNNGSACGDAESAQGDAQSAQGDYQSFQGDEQSFSTDVSSQQAGSGTLQSDWSAYRNAQAVLPGYVPSSVPRASQVQAALQQVSSSVLQFTAYESQVASSGQTLVNQANQVANTLVNQACG